MPWQSWHGPPPEIECRPSRRRKYKTRGTRGVVPDPAPDRAAVAADVGMPDVIDVTAHLTDDDDDDEDDEQHGGNSKRPKVDVESDDSWKSVATTMMRSTLDATSHTATQP